MAYGTVHNLAGFQQGLRRKEGYLRRLSIDDKGCVLYLPLNSVEGGKVKDLSGKGNNGTVHGAVLSDIGDQYPISWKDKLINIGGKALSFDGVDDYVEVPDSNSLDITDAITIEAWVKPNDIFDSSRTDWDGVVGKSVQYFLDFNPDNGKLRFHLSGLSSTNLESTKASWDTVWAHIVGTWDGSIMKIYVDGILDSSQESTGTITSDTSDITVGAYSTAPSDLFHGLIDEVRIYNRALSASEIAEHYRILKPLFV